MNEDKNVFLKKDSDSVGKTVPMSVLTAVVCLVAALSILFTYTFTSASKRRYYSDKLAAQEEKIDQLSGQTSGNFEDLELIAEIFERYAYYAGDVSEEELLTAVLKAYAEATGDDYAEYYTEAEYAEIVSQNAGDLVGIGVSVIQTTVEVNSVTQPVYQIIAIYPGSSAEGTSLKVGDYIYAVETEDERKTVADLGYTKFLAAFKGESGTTVSFSVFRTSGDTVESIDFSILRAAFESTSVSAKLAENDPKTAIVQITNFDLTTPTQFKATVNACLENGVEHFVFDVRNNPGGDLQSIKAVLSYFLQENDLILSAIDRNGRVARSYVAAPTTLTGDYASCNVTKEEIGMYAHLDMVVLCNQNTASAAEVFTATLRDYGLAKIVGDTTFGKGIMQTFLPLSSFGSQYSGYLKFTNYAYVTKCGVTYHDIGIVPEVEVALSAEALQYNFYVLPQALDNQLQTALAQFE